MATTTTAATSPNHQDWFLMTGDLIINLRSTKTGDSALFNPKNAKKNFCSKFSSDIQQQQQQRKSQMKVEEETTDTDKSKSENNDNNTITSTSKISNSSSTSSSGNSSSSGGVTDDEQLMMMITANESGYSDCLSTPSPTSNVKTSTSYANSHSSDYGFFTDTTTTTNKSGERRTLSSSASSSNGSNPTVVVNNSNDNQDEQKENCYENIVDCRYLTKSQESNLYNLIEDKTTTTTSSSTTISDGNDDDDDDDVVDGDVHSIGMESDSCSLVYYSNRNNNNQNQQQQQCIDTASASRLARRLYNLEGFKKSDVSRHLSKNNEFCRAVAGEYLKLFDFTGQELDEALRNFFSFFHLIGETHERERVLVYFSKRYLECNPNGNEFKSADSIHTLTCALMLLNTDLHEENIQRKMTCSNFILNLSGLNDGEDYPTELLKYLYYSVKNNPLGWMDDDSTHGAVLASNKKDRNVFAKITTISRSISSPYATLPRRFSQNSPNPFVDVPNPSFAIEYKKGYIRRKCCYESNGKRTSLGKRSWKLFYATLRDLVLYLHKDENGFRKSQLQESFANSIRIHHAIASIADDYPKKKFVFRLITADYAEYLFETSDSKELQSWVETINTTAASLSAPTLPMPVGSKDNHNHRRSSLKKEIFPVSHTKLSMRDQLKDQENKLLSLQKELELLLEKSCDKSLKPYHKGFLEKETYLQHEIKRYRVYVACLKKELAAKEAAIDLAQGPMTDHCSGSSISSGSQQKNRTSTGSDTD